jgi:hypothetical protein
MQVPFAVERTARIRVEDGITSPTPFIWVRPKITLLVVIPKTIVEDFVYPSNFSRPLWALFGTPTRYGTTSIKFAPPPPLPYGEYGIMIGTFLPPVSAGRYIST